MDPTNYLSEINRVSKDGAIVHMTIPNILSYYSRLRMLFGLLPVAITSNPTHVKFYSKKSLIYLINPPSLTVVMF
jgi:hypothetical protein